MSKKRIDGNCRVAGCFGEGVKGLDYGGDVMWLLKCDLTVRKIVMNLSPAEQRKDGALFDFDIDLIDRYGNSG